MAISIFPSTAAEFVSNNFVIDMNDTSNNTADTGGVKQAGPYSMSFSSGDSSFDVYLIDEDGNSVGYSNNTSIVASGLFATVVIFGVAQDEVISFLYQGSVNNADGEGDEPGAGAYLESISPTDLPSIDDTATVSGGNFGADTEIYFDSGAISLPAKNITVNNSTELIVTRPDSLIEDDSPYTLRAVTTGVPEPTGTNVNLLVDEVTAGSDPTWVTTSPLNTAAPGVTFSQTLEATDAEGTVVDYSVTAGTITPGLTLNSSTGVLSGTPTTVGNYTFTVTATDDGGNTTAKQFEQPVLIAEGGVKTSDANFTYHTFTSSDTFELFADIDVKYLVIAGGGGGGGKSSERGGGGGGAGGLLNATVSSLSAGNYTITVGAGGVGGTTSGNAGSNGSSSAIVSVATAIGGGGGGGYADINGKSGGSGGGGSGVGTPGSASGSGGAGTSGQGNSGGNGESAPSSISGTRAAGGGGGGKLSSGSNAESFFVGGNPGAGITLNDWASASGIGSGQFAGGGHGSSLFEAQPQTGGTSGTGHGGIGKDENSDGSGDTGRDGVVIVRYAS